MDTDAFPGFSDFNPAVDQAATEVNNAQDWTVLQEANTETTALEQQVIDDRQAVMDHIAYENGLLLSDQDYGGTADSAEGALHKAGETPEYRELSPLGRDIVVTGNPNAYADFCHEQGQNDLGFSGDCGLCSAQDVLNQFGVDVSENDVVHHAVDNHLCDIDPNCPDNSGGTTADWERQTLTDYGVPAHVENNGSLDDLAQHIENGSGVIAEVNAGVLWNDPNSFEDGSANHAITVTGVARDPDSGQILGFYVNDSGDGHAAKLIDADTMQMAWADAGGQSVVTDIIH